MNIYKDYIKQIEDRKGQGLNPLPIDGAELLSAIIDQVKDLDNKDREASLNFFIYNVLPGTTSAAGVKAIFLKEIVLGETPSRLSLAKDSIKPKLEKKANTSLNKMGSKSSPNINVASVPFSCPPLNHSNKTTII